jgi:hypothetical protein
MQIAAFYYHADITFCDPILNGASVAPTSEVRTSAMLLLQTEGNENCTRLG